MRAKSGRWYLILLVALFVLFGGQTAWAAAPTITSNPDPILSPTEDEVGYEVTFTASDADGDLESFDVINQPTFFLLEKTTQSQIKLYTTIDVRPLATNVDKSYTFYLSAADKAGAITRVPYTITVEEFNDSPVIQNKIVSDTATQGEVYSFSFTVTDEENDPLSWNPDAVDTQKPEWLSVVKGDEYGSFSITSTTPITNEIALGDSPVQIRIQIDDDPQNPDLEVKSDSIEYLLNLINVNDAPEITDGDITSDDAIEETPYEHRFTVEDIDGDTLTVVRPIAKKPAWISVAASTDANDPPNTWIISGTPNNEDALSTEPQEVDITIQDEEGLNARLQYTISIQNLNDTPEQISGFAAPEFATQDEAFTHSFTVKDDDLDTVKWNQQNSSYPSSWMEVAVVTQPDNVYQFNITGTPKNSDVLPVGGVQKTDTVTIAFTDDATITDPDLEEPNSASFTFDITYVNVNDAPQIAAGGTFPDSVDQDATYEHTFTVTDADGNDLRIVSSGMRLPAWTTEPMTITPAAGGPSGTDFTISGTPNWEDANQSELYSVVIKIGDGVQGDEKFITKEFTISVVNLNDKPEITMHPIQDQEADTLAVQNSVYSKPITFTDKDNDTVSWIKEDSTFPDGMDVVSTGSNNFEIDWTPTNDQVTHIRSEDGATLEQVSDPYNVALKFCDDFETTPKCETVSITDLRVENVNDAPTISGTIDALVAGEYTQDSPYIFTPEVSDADQLFGDVTFTFSITGQSGIVDWSFFNIENGQLQLYPSASHINGSPYSISLAVSDGEKKATLPLDIIVLSEAIKEGDFNLDNSVDLTDVISVLKIMAGIDLPDDQAFKVQTATDPNDDGMAGLADVIYILHQIATP